MAASYRLAGLRGQDLRSGARAPRRPQQGDGACCRGATISDPAGRNGGSAGVLDHSARVDTAADLIEKLCLPTSHLLPRPPRDPRRWLQWLEDHGGIEGRPRAAVLARSSPRCWGGPSRPSTGPRPSIAGRTGPPPGPRTRPPRRGPPSSGPCSAGMGPRRCAPTPTRRCACSPRSTSCTPDPWSGRGLPEWSAVTSTAQTSPFRTRSASASKSVRTRRRGRAARAVAAGHGPQLMGPGRDPGRSGPDRARPGPPRPGRPGRGQGARSRDR
jgi:hypothetical protein